MKVGLTVRRGAWRPSMASNGRPRACRGDWRQGATHASCAPHQHQQRRVNSFTGTSDLSDEALQHARKAIRQQQAAPRFRSHQAAAVQLLLLQHLPIRHIHHNIGGAGGDACRVCRLCERREPSAMDSSADVEMTCGVDTGQQEARCGSRKGLAQPEAAQPASSAASAGIGNHLDAAWSKDLCDDRQHGQMLLHLSQKSPPCSPKAAPVCPAHSLSAGRSEGLPELTALIAYWMEGHGMHVGEAAETTVQVHCTSCGTSCGRVYQRDGACTIQPSLCVPWPRRSLANACLAW